MTPEQFVKTLYLGDRCCKRVTIDGWEGCIRIEADRISRIRSASGEWEFYDREDIVDGSIVFDRVREFALRPQGLLPNDAINYLSVESRPGERDEARPVYTFTMSVDSVSRSAQSLEVLLCIVAEGIHLEDPARPGFRITE